MAADTELASRIPEQAGEIDDRQLQDIRLYDERLTPEYTRQRQAVDRAIKDVFDCAKHNTKNAPPTNSRAQIRGSGVAGYSDNPDGHVAYEVNRATGTMVLAESTLTAVGAQAAARGFERAMRVQRTAGSHIGAATGQVHKAVHETIPKIKERAFHALGTDAEDSGDSTLAVQIVDNKLVYDGSRPCYVYNVDTDHCVRLTGAPGIQEDTYILDPGRNIIVMSSGRASEENLPPAFKLREVLRESLGQAPDDIQAATGSLADGEAGRLAMDVLQGLATDEAMGAILVNTVDVALWEDTRPAWAQKLDWMVRAPSSLAYLGISRGKNRRQTRRYDEEAIAGEPYDIARREAYEMSSRTTRLLWRMGDIATDAALLWGTFLLARTALAAGGIDLFGHHGGGSGTTLHHPLTQPTVAHPTHTSPTTTTITAPNPNVAPKPTFAQTYVAHAHDPANGGSASNLTNLSRQTLEFYGKQAGLSPASIHTLTHSSTVLDELNSAFMHDSSNPHNHVVLQNSHHWLYANKGYSTHDMSELAQKVVANHAPHTGGVTVPHAAPGAGATHTPVPGSTPSSGPTHVETPSPTHRPSPRPRLAPSSTPQVPTPTPTLEPNVPAPTLTPNTPAPSLVQAQGGLPISYPSSPNHIPATNPEPAKGAVAPATALSYGSADGVNQTEGIEVTLSTVGILGVGIAAIRALRNRSRVAGLQQAIEYGNALRAAFGAQPARAQDAPAISEPKKSALGRFRDRRDNAARRREARHDDTW